jgi:hypothetical protein
MERRPRLPLMLLLQMKTPALGELTAILEAFSTSGVFGWWQLRGYYPIYHWLGGPENEVAAGASCP